MVIVSLLSSCIASGVASNLSFPSVRPLLALKFSHHCVRTSSNSKEKNTLSLQESPSLSMACLRAPTSFSSLRCLTPLRRKDCFVPSHIELRPRLFRNGLGLQEWPRPLYLLPSLSLIHTHGQGHTPPSFERSEATLLLFVDSSRQLVLFYGAIPPLPLFTIHRSYPLSSLIRLGSAQRLPSLQVRTPFTTLSSR